MKFFFLQCLQSPHQVDMKNVVKCWKEFFSHFNALERHSTFYLKLSFPKRLIRKINKKIHIQCWFQYIYLWLTQLLNKYFNNISFEIIIFKRRTQIIDKKIWIPELLLMVYKSAPVFTVLFSIHNTKYTFLWLFYTTKEYKLITHKKFHLWLKQ